MQRLRIWRSDVRMPAGNRDFLFSETSTLVLGPTQPPIQCVSGSLSLRDKTVEAWGRL